MRDPRRDRHGVGRIAGAIFWANGGTPVCACVQGATCSCGDGGGLLLDGQAVATTSLSPVSITPYPRHLVPCPLSMSPLSLVPLVHIPLVTVPLAHAGPQLRFALPTCACGCHCYRRRHPARRRYLAPAHHRHPTLPPPPTLPPHCCVTNAMIAYRRPLRGMTDYLVDAIAPRTPKLTGLLFGPVTTSSRCSRQNRLINLIVSSPSSNFSVCQSS